jgi:hypothetical protein
MRQVILHLGFSKCGSSSIQESLAKFDDGQTVYARLGRPNHNMVFHSVFGHPPYSLSGFRRLSLDPSELQDYRRKCFRNLQTQLSRTDRDRVIFSGENIASLKKNELVSLRDFLLGYTREILVIAYVRHPLDYCPSAFQQRVKGGLFEIPDIISPSYIQQITKLRHVFAGSQLQILNFDRQKLIDKCIVKDFCSRINVNVDHVINKNVSLSAYAVKCLYLFNQIVNSDFPEILVNYKLRDEFRALLAGLFPERMPFDIDLFVDLYSRDDLSYLVEAVGMQYDSSALIAKEKTSFMRLGEWLVVDHRDINERINQWLLDHGHSLVHSSNKEAVASLFARWSWQYKGLRQIA